MRPWMVNHDTRTFGPALPVPARLRRPNPIRVYKARTPYLWVARCICSEDRTFIAPGYAGDWGRRHIAQHAAVAERLGTVPC